MRNERPEKGGRVRRGRGTYHDVLFRSECFEP